MKKFFVFLVIFILGFSLVAFAAPTSSIFRTILPETTDIYDLGSASKVWNNLYVKNLVASTSLSYPITSNYFVGTSTATSTFSGDILSPFGSFWNGLEVSKITATSTTATSTFAGGLESWAHIATPYFVATSTTATSTFSGNISANNIQARNNLIADITFTDSGNAVVGGTVTASNFTATSTTATSAFSGNITVTGTTGLTGLLTAVNASTTQIGSTGSAYFATAGGNVGIGTTSPSYKLDVYTTGDNVLRLTDNDIMPTFSILNGDSSGAEFKIMRAASVFTGAIENDVAFVAPTSRSLRIGQGTTEYMVIKSGGNVGIGTTSPASLLDTGAKGNGTRTYIQIDSEAGAPAAGDCDSLNETGRMIIDHTNNVLYVCNQHAGRGWDTITLTD